MFPAWNPVPQWMRVASTVAVQGSLAVREAGEQEGEGDEVHWGHFGHLRGACVAAPLSVPDQLHAPLSATTTWGHSVKSRPSSGRSTQLDPRMGADLGHLSE